MSMGLKRMQGLGWTALVFLVAILLYPLSLNVGAMHAKLMRTDSQIVETRREISYLEAEIRARASLEQLEKWNDLLYGYDAPQAAQYLGSQRALADMHGDDLGPQTPIMVSASYGLNSAPMGTIGTGGQMASAADTAGVAAKPAQSAANMAGDSAPKASETVSVAAASPAKTSPAKTSSAKSSSAKPSPAAARATQEKRVAQLESSLLGPSALRDIQARSAAERKQ